MGVRKNNNEFKMRGRYCIMRRNGKRIKTKQLKRKCKCWITSKILNVNDIGKFKMDNVIGKILGTDAVKRLHKTQKKEICQQENYRIIGLLSCPKLWQ